MIFPFDQRLMISQECGWLDENGGPFDSARMKKEGPEGKEEPIVRGEIGRTFSRAGEKDQLLLQQEVFGNQGLHAADPEHFGNHAQEVSENHEHIFHGWRA